MTTPVNPVDRPNSERSIAGDMIDPELQHDINQDPIEDDVE